MNVQDAFDERPLTPMTVEEINVISAAARTRPPTGDQTHVLVPDGEDPWVVAYDGRLHYCTVDRPKRRILISSFHALTEMADAPLVEVWPRDGSDVPDFLEIWAPELQRIDGRWFIYFSLYNGNTGNERMHVLEGGATDPQGPYTYKGSLEVPTARWAIDGTVIEINDMKYLLWSGWEGMENDSQNLYIASLSDPWTVSSDRSCISRPELPWERSGYPYINEGPQALQRDGRLFVIYSASGSWTDDYCLGQLTYLGGDPLDPANWQKAPEPVFSRTDTIFGPGHCCFVEIDGEDWLLYHAARLSGAGWARQVRAKKFGWHPDGSPDFGVPL